MFPEQDEQQVFARLTDMFEERRITPAALGALLDKLKEQPHVRTEAPSDARLRDIEDRIILDRLNEANNEMHKYRHIFGSTPHEMARSTNFSYLDYKETDEALNECAICAVVKAKCLDPAKHFGSKGESPPETVCEACGEWFYNHYDSEYKLALHRALPGKCRPEKLESNTSAKALNDARKTAPLQTTWSTTPRSSKKPKKNNK